jgi:DNA mismatch endonuclease (patch repair protein)
VFRRCRLAVFIDGDFWHGRNFQEWRTKVSAFWVTKIEGNMERDRRAKADLEAQGWRVLNFWSKDVDKDPESCVERILTARTSRLRSKNGRA